MVKARIKYKVRFVSDLASDPENFYVRMWPVVDVKYRLTDDDRRELIREVKQKLATALKEAK